MLQDIIARLASKTAEPNFRPWNVDTHAHARKAGIVKGDVIYHVTYLHEPEVTHTITGRKLATIGRFI